MNSGVRRVQGFPSAKVRWTGSEGMFVRAGFARVGEAARGPVYERMLSG